MNCTHESKLPQEKLPCRNFAGYYKKKGRHPSFENGSDYRHDAVL
jgi:hypothetical protein